jgi:hypothetical protein
LEKQKGTDILLEAPLKYLILTKHHAEPGALEQYELIMSGQEHFQFHNTFK